MVLSRSLKARRLAVAAVFAGSLCMRLSKSSTRQMAMGGNERSKELADLLMTVENACVLQNYSFGGTPAPQGVKVEVKTQCCSVPDNDIASTSHLAKTEGWWLMLPSAGRAPWACSSNLLLLISSTTTLGALGNTNATLAHLARSLHDPLDAALWLRRE